MAVVECKDSLNGRGGVEVNIVGGIHPGNDAGSTTQPGDCGHLSSAAPSVL